ncbi:MAG: putative sulfate exporter family transporter [Acidobacteriaceae bacterium]
MTTTATQPIEQAPTDRAAHQPAHQPPHKLLDSRTVFLLGLLVAGSGIVNPPVALVGGIAFGFLVEHPLRAESAKLSKLLLQASVVALGFGMNILQVAHAGRSGFAYTAISITTAMVLGTLIGKLLSVGGKASFLITAGTAICGGSAIAAVAPITNANEEEISVSMGTVFLLNSIALLLFPPIGHLLHLTQNQFGLWAALAIHDTSSVVGAAAAYGNQALAIGTTVKLARALWIVPVSLITAAVMARMAARQGHSKSHHAAKVKFPWFIAYFCAAAALSTYLPRFHIAFAALSHLGKAGLTATLFLIGTSLSKRTLRQVGVRPLVQGVALWIIVGTASLAAIYFHIIGI